MTGPLYYDKQGAPISRERWCALVEDNVYKRIALTELANHTSISTVWLGIDHRFRGEGAPLIFETMVFRDGFEATDGTAAGRTVCRQYTTLAEAILGHEEVVFEWSHAVA